MKFCLIFIASDLYKILSDLLVPLSRREDLDIEAIKMPIKLSTFSKQLDVDKAPTLESSL